MKKIFPYGLMAILILAVALSGCGGGSSGGGGGNNGGGNSGGGGGTTPASWQVVGSPGFSAGRAYIPSLTIDGSGVPYVVYQDTSNGDKATVMKYSGGAWTPVGSPGFSADPAYNLSLAIDGSGALYVASQSSAYSSQPTVMKYSGGMWFGGLITKIGGGTKLKFAIDGSGALYLANLNGSGTVGVWRCGEGGWTQAFSAGSDSEFSLVTDRNGVPYLACFTDNDSTLSLFKGGETWTLLSTVQFRRYSAIQLAFDGNGAPYVSYGDFNHLGPDGLSRLTVIKYAGGTWAAVGNPGFSGQVHGSHSIAIDKSGTPYVAYMDLDNGDKATVMKYSGGVWTPVGSPGFSVGGQLNFLSFAIDGSGVPYVAYQDGDNMKVTVMKYAP